MVVEEQLLGEVVERVVAREQPRPVPVLEQEAVADAVDRPDEQVGEIALVPHLLRVQGDPVAQLVGGLLGERADEDLGWLRLPRQEQVEGPPDEDLGLARARPGDDQERAVRVGHRPHLGRVVPELRVGVQQNLVDATAFLAARRAERGGADGPDHPQEGPWRSRPMEVRRVSRVGVTLPRAGVRRDSTGIRSSLGRPAFRSRAPPLAASPTSRRSTSSAPTSSPVSSTPSRWRRCRAPGCAAGWEAGRQRPGHRISDAGTWSPAASPVGWSVADLTVLREPDALLREGSEDRLADAEGQGGGVVSERHRDNGVRV